MHHAPPVSYPVGRSRAVGAAALIACVAGLVATAFWALQDGESGWRKPAALLALPLAAWACRAWRASPSGSLSWDGQSWHWSGGGGEKTGQLAVCLDFQQLLLLRWQAENARAHWLWLERGRMPARWNELRRAVYSRANPDALPEAEPPAANS